MAQLSLFDIGTPNKGPWTSKTLEGMILSGVRLILLTGRNPHLVIVRTGELAGLRGDFVLRKDAVRILTRAGYYHHCNVWSSIAFADGRQKSEVWRKNEYP